jgi:hypothetical protein
MYIEQALLTKLTGTAALTALVGERIELVRPRQDIEAPYIALQKISDVHGKVFAAPEKLQTARFQLSIFASTYKACKDIADAVQTAIDGFTGTMGGAGGLSVGDCWHDGETDLPYDSELNLYGLAVDYLISYTR